MLRKCCRVVTFAYMHVTGTENQITCTPAIQWVMKVYVNGLLIYNVPHLLYLSVHKWRFSVDRKWSRTAAKLLGRNTWQHSSKMWITWTVAIRLVRQLDLICLLVCNVPHAHSTDVYRKRDWWLIDWLIEDWGLRIELHRAEGVSIVNCIEPRAI